MSGASFAIRSRLLSGGTFVFPWLGMAGAAQAGQIARLGFDAVAVDLQHGMVGEGDAPAMVAAITAAGLPAVIRVRWNEPGLVGFALDMGAAAVIAPMVNSAAEAKALVKSAKYPPLGQRSWGGYAMVQTAGVSAAEYLRDANSHTLVFAMIETREALAALDEIAAVKGLDGLFVGPSDLTIALTDGGSLDRSGAATIAAMRKVAEVCKSRGLVAGAFAGTPDFCRAYAALGFRFMAGPTDTDLFNRGAEAFRKAAAPN